MITFKRPSDNQIAKMLRKVADAPFTYDAVGCVSRQTPPGFNRDAASFELGHGEHVWNAAVEAIRTWSVFPTSMVTTVRLSDEINVGTVLATVCPSLGTWATCPARLLCTEDTERDGIHSFGFSYGTLPGHVESGEERFCVKWDTKTDVVTYHIEAVSRPQHILCWLAYPYTRMMQAKFRRLSGAAVQTFVMDHSTGADVASRQQPVPAVV